jgi:hypothetical protein
MSDINTTPPHSLFDLPFLSRLRRNHGLEHACLHVLASRHPGRNLAGHSDFKGFWLLGNLTTDEVREGVQEAQERLRAGEHNLAVHPNCGTNFVTAGTLAGFAGLMGMSGVGSRPRDKLERLPLVAILATLGLILAQPLGLVMQRVVTTSGDIADLEVVEITPAQRGRMKAHRVRTRGG